MCKQQADRVVLRSIPGDNLSGLQDCQKVQELFLSYVKKNALSATKTMHEWKTTNPFQHENRKSMRYT